MKIIFDNQIFTLQSYGGISRYYVEMISELYKINSNTSIYAGLNKNNYLYKLPKDIIHEIKVSNYLPYTTKIIMKLNNYFFKKKIFEYNPDIIHYTYYNYANISKKHNKAKRIITIFDMIHEIFPNMFNKKDITSSLKKSAILNSDHIISISNSTKNDLINLLGVPEEKISVVHLASNNYANKLLENNKYKKFKPYILYVGKRNGYKNFKRFIKALSISKKIKENFKIIAFGGGNFNKLELNYISELGFEEDQVVNINDNDDTLIDLYRNASALVYPSLYEGFGIPLLEAMSCNCPVISSNVSSMPEVVGNAGEYFNPNDIDEMKHVIESVILSNEKIDELKNKGLERVKLFSWKKCANETFEIYNKKI